MLADQDHGETRSAAGAVAETRNFTRDPLAKRQCGGLSIDQARRHPTP